ncbi:winged helix-turn-helix domain-containing protein [Rugosimonospora acidiphila]
MTDSVRAWRVLFEDLCRLIRSGRLVPGDRLPSETALIAQTGLSRTTVRQAIGQLRSVGLVSTLAPKGTFVLGTPDPVRLMAGESVTAEAALTLTRADGSTALLPAGTPIVCAATR